MITWGGADFYRAQNTPLIVSVLIAYLSVQGFMTVGSSERIVNAPEWLKQDKYDIYAKVAPEDVEAWQKQGLDKPLMQQMLRAAFTDRLKLRAHMEIRNAPAYALMLTKAMQLKPADPSQPDPPGAQKNVTGGKIVPYRRGDDPTITLVQMTMAEFALFLSNSSSRPIVDKTGFGRPVHLPSHQTGYWWRGAK